MAVTTKLVSFKLPIWFVNALNAAKKKTPERTATEIVVDAVCKREKIKAPKDHKFVKPRQEK